MPCLKSCRVLSFFLILFPLLSIHRLFFVFPYSWLYVPLLFRSVGVNACFVVPRLGLPRATLAVLGLFLLLCAVYNLGYLTPRASRKVDAQTSSARESSLVIRMPHDSAL